MNYVYVLNKDGKPLMPTSRFGKVRRMLRSGQAVVVDQLPFTIRLTYRTKTEVVQPVTAGQDPGRTNIGMATVRSDGKCLYRSHTKTRNKQIPKLMAERKAHRQASRRGERLVRKRLAKKHQTFSKKLGDQGRRLPGCEEPLAVKDIINTEAKFNNRLREEGWLTPTATQLLRTHIELFKKVSEILPVSDVALEINKFAFMQLDNPDMKKWNIDFQHGPLYGKGGVKSAVHELQNGICLLCGKREIEHYHHIVPRSKRGSDTVENYAGLCERCHEKVHKSQEAADCLAAKKAGLTKKYGGTSVLNQIIPFLTEELAKLFPDHLHLTTGVNTKAYREQHHLEKDHDIDAYCIAVSTMENIKPDRDLSSVSSYEIKQFRKHDRAGINYQTERVYKLDNKIVAKNRHKRMEQKTDSLEEWYEKMSKQYGSKKADQLRSKLTIQKSTRAYNTAGRVMPGAVFKYHGKRYVMTGQLTGGQYYRAYDQGNKNFPAKQVVILLQNSGLVYVAWLREKKQPYG